MKVNFTSYTIQEIDVTDKGDAHPKTIPTSHTINAKISDDEETVFMTVQLKTYINKNTTIQEIEGVVKHILLKITYSEFFKY